MVQKNNIIAVKQWFGRRGWKPMPFQLHAWECYAKGNDVLINAPTGTGKTFAAGGGAAAEFLNESKFEKGVKLIWITPVRALAAEIQESLSELFSGVGLKYDVAVRTGDTPQKERARQKRKNPDVLITTPESLHLILASKGAEKFFAKLRCIVCDEWHELTGSKRGVLMELALSRIKSYSPTIRVWGMSATIGNMSESAQMLFGSDRYKNYKLIKAELKKKIEVKSITPGEPEKFPWAGRQGLKMIERVIPVVMSSKTTLIFTNTRSQCEIWYRSLLEKEPELAGRIAMHHGSLSREIRGWVEEALHTEKLKAVVCTASLDLGVDFRPVETVIQIGSPKGVARFSQRAGRSGHNPGAVSKIYFVPTHSLELIEGAALRKAIDEEYVESRVPYIRSFDVLVQYLTTLAVGDGFKEKQIFEEVAGTFCFRSISSEEWKWCLNFIVTGGDSLQSYDEYKKVTMDENGIHKVLSRRTAGRHRLQIGTIVSDASLSVKFVSGGRIGTIEESFISKLEPGETFWFAGRSLELVRFKGMTVEVRASKNKNGKVPSWQGGRMPLSSNLAELLRFKLHEAASGKTNDPELTAVLPLLKFQKERSVVPSKNQLLIEVFKTRRTFHCCIYPFDGRFVHEGIAGLLAHRFAKFMAGSFSISVNDYGFELAGDSEIPIEQAVNSDIFAVKNLYEDIQNSMNFSEPARRQFREIAGISGLVFKGFPGKSKADRHLQASSRLFFEVFRDYEPGNLLYKQAFDEVLQFQLEYERLYRALKRIEGMEIVLSRPEKPTPFAFPIMVERLRERFTSEKLEERIKKMELSYA